MYYVVSVVVHTAARRALSIRSCLAARECLYVSTWGCLAVAARVLLEPTVSFSFASFAFAVWHTLHPVAPALRHQRHLPVTPPLRQRSQLVASSSSCGANDARGCRGSGQHLAQPRHGRRLQQSYRG